MNIFANKKILSKYVVSLPIKLLRKIVYFGNFIDDGKLMFDKLLVPWVDASAFVGPPSPYIMNMLDCSEQAINELLPLENFDNIKIYVDGSGFSNDQDAS